MQVFNLKTMKSYPYEERDRNVFYKDKQFKTRIIELPQYYINLILFHAFVF